MAKSKPNAEFRYYEIPSGEYVLALLGKGWEISYGSDVPVGLLHFHNYLEIGYCYHGAGEVIISGRTYRYGDDMFTIIPANILHTTNSDPGNICKWEFLFIDIDNYIRHELSNGGFDVHEIIRIVNQRGTLKTLKGHPQTARLIRCIIEECREKKKNYREALKGYLRALVFEIMRIAEEHEQFHYKSVEYNQYLESVFRYIEAHFDENLQVQDLAAICQLSESHFRRVFYLNTNMSPLNYLNMVRIEKACEILNKEDLQVEDVGYKVGFKTPSSFFRNFKSFTGLTPYQWKKQSAEKRDVSEKLHVRAKKGWQASEWADRYKDIWAKLHAEDADEKVSVEQLESGEIDADITITPGWLEP